MKKLITLIIVLLIEVIVVIIPIRKLSTSKNEIGDLVETEPTTVITITEETTAETTKVIPTTTKKKTTKKVVKSSGQVKSGTYKLTHYGPDCRGCSGVTASGYNVKNTIWYNDSEYGQVRVVATSRQFKMYSIIRIKDYKLGGDVTAIVLDRGVGSGVIDLLVKSEKAATQLGIQRVNIEVLRYGK